MNNFRKIRKNAKALSPVVASIILIAVTVAVSIAVAAWMGGLTVGFMQTEQATITNTAFAGTDNATSTIVLSVSNTGTNAITFNSATVNSASAAVTGSSVTIAKNSAGTVTVTAPWTSGNNYQIKLVSAKGNNFVYSAIAP